jgi:hypothetical protein
MAKTSMAECGPLMDLGTQKFAPLWK